MITGTLKSSINNITYCQNPTFHVSDGKGKETFWLQEVTSTKLHKSHSTFSTWISFATFLSTSGRPFDEEVSLGSLLFFFTLSSLSFFSFFFFSFFSFLRLRLRLLLFRFCLSWEEHWQNHAANERGSKIEFNLLLELKVNSIRASASSRKHALSCFLFLAN